MLLQHPELLQVVVGSDLAPTRTKGLAGHLHVRLLLLHGSLRPSCIYVLYLFRFLGCQMGALLLIVQVA